MPQKDPEARRQYMQAWRAKNPDKVRANSQRRAPNAKVYRRAHLDQYAGYQRNRRNKFPREALIDQARSRARKFGLQCDLTVEALLWPTHCPVLGVELDYNRTTAGERKIRTNSPTLDRHDNSKGYVVGNVFVVSHRANRIKSDATSEELLAVARYAAGEHLNS